MATDDAQAKAMQKKMPLYCGIGIIFLVLLQYGNGNGHFGLLNALGLAAGVLLILRYLVPGKPKD